MLTPAATNESALSSTMASITRQVRLSMRNSFRVQPNFSPMDGENTENSFDDLVTPMTGSAGKRKSFGFGSSDLYDSDDLATPKSRRRSQYDDDSIKRWVPFESLWISVCIYKVNY